MSIVRFCSRSRTCGGVAVLAALSVGLLLAGGCSGSAPQSQPAVQQKTAAAKKTATGEKTAAGHETVAGQSEAGSPTGDEKQSHSLALDPLAELSR